MFNDVDTSGFQVTFTEDFEYISFDERGIDGAHVFLSLRPTIDGKYGVMVNFTACEIVHHHAETAQGALKWAFAWIASNRVITAENIAYHQIRLLKNA